MWIIQRFGGFMTKKEFRQAMLKGQGRCILAVKAAPEKYRSEVLWACSHELAFDPQCEGSRAWYVFQMICCYEDSAPFLRVLIKTLEAVPAWKDWKMLYLAEILKYFADDGDAAALQSIRNKYDELYAMLSARKRCPNRYFYERGSFEWLCVLLADRKRNAVKIADDIGALLRKEAVFDFWDFDYFSWSVSKYMPTLEARAAESENIRLFLDCCRKKDQAEAERKRGSSHRNKETQQTFIGDYLNEKDPEKRTKALRKYLFSGFPADPAPVIDDTQSDHEMLRNTAWRVLAKTKEPSVRAYAMEQLSAGVEDALSVLIGNFQPEDEQMLVHQVLSLKGDRDCTTGWHGAQSDVLRMADAGVKAPQVLLRYIYESSYCSCCRANAVRQLGKRRLLPKDTLEECQFDSNGDIRDYAAKLLRRRNNKKGE